MNLGLVKDSICCNEISDKWIKQTYIISLNTFFLLLIVVSYSFSAPIQFLYFSGLCMLSFSLSTKVFPKSLATLVSSPRTDFGKQNAVLPSPSELFNLTTTTTKKTLKWHPYTQELNAWCGVHPVYCKFAYSCCYNVHLLLNVCFLNLAHD